MHHEGLSVVVKNSRLGTRARGPAESRSGAPRNAPALLSIVERNSRRPDFPDTREGRSAIYSQFVGEIAIY